MRAVQSLHLFSFVIQEDGWPVLRACEALRMIGRGRWSLPMCWLAMMLDAVAEARVRSIVVGLPVDESILVARLCGVRRHMELLLSRASEMDGCLSRGLCCRN